MNTKQRKQSTKAVINEFYKNNPGWSIYKVEMNFVEFCSTLTRAVENVDGFKFRIIQVNHSSSIYEPGMAKIVFASINNLYTIRETIAYVDDQDRYHKVRQLRTGTLEKPKPLVQLRDLSKSSRHSNTYEMDLTKFDELDDNKKSKKSKKNKKHSKKNKNNKKNTKHSKKNSKKSKAFYKKLNELKTRVSGDNITRNIKANLQSLQSIPKCLEDLVLGYLPKHDGNQRDWKHILNEIMNDPEIGEYRDVKMKLSKAKFNERDRIDDEYLLWFSIAEEEELELIPQEEIQYLQSLGLL